MTEESNNRTSRRSSVFISYAQQDKLTAQFLAIRLQEVGIDVWLDTDIQPGESWRDIVDRRLRISDYFIVLLSSASVNSQHFKSEVLRRDFLQGLNDRSIAIIPILLDDVPIPLSFLGMLFLDFRTDPKPALEKLVKTLAPAIEIDFSMLSPRQFEELVAELLFSLGYEVEREAHIDAHTFDLRVPFTHDDPFGGRILEDWLIEVKHYSSGRLRVEQLHQFAADAMPTLLRNPMTRIAFVISGQLTSAARELVQQMPIRIVEGIELKRLMLTRPELIRKHFGGQTLK